jgi:hypothetical protein
MSQVTDRLFLIGGGNMEYHIIPLLSTHRRERYSNSQRCRGSCKSNNETITIMIVNPTTMRSRPGPPLQSLYLLVCVVVATALHGKLFRFCWQELFCLQMAAINISFLLQIATYNNKL